MSPPLPTGDILIAYNLGEDATSILWVETKEASQHPILHRQPPEKELSDLKYQ